jgi:hypothetical protein
MTPAQRHWRRLNARGVRTAWGSDWHSPTVRNIILRSKR